MTQLIDRVREIREAQRTRGENSNTPILGVDPYGQIYEETPEQVQQHAKIEARSFAQTEGEEPAEPTPSVPLRTFARQLQEEREGETSETGQPAIMVTGGRIVENIQKIPRTLTEVEAKAFSSLEDESAAPLGFGSVQRIAERLRGSGERHGQTPRRLLELDGGDMREIGPDDATMTAQIPSKAFAHYPGLAHDRRVARQKMKIAREKSYSRITGFEYDLRINGRRYVLFAYFDPPARGYKVMVIEPNVNGKYNPHNGHLFSDGHICFGEKANSQVMDSLESAYAKSVLWAHGFDRFLRTGTFPY